MSNNSSLDVETEECTALLETIYYSSTCGFSLLNRHLDRLFASRHQLHWSCVFNRNYIIQRLNDHVNSIDNHEENLILRIRLLCYHDGLVTINSTTLPTDSSSPLNTIDMFPCCGKPFDASIKQRRVVLATTSVSSTDWRLRHKTTSRQPYNAARHVAGIDNNNVVSNEIFDVLLFNECNEVTETSIANVAVLVTNQWLTPALECGLLAGCMRAELIALGLIHEGHVTVNDVLNAPNGGVVCFNSVRGVYPVCISYNATTINTMID